MWGSWDLLFIFIHVHGLNIIENWLPINSYIAASSTLANKRTNAPRPPQWGLLDAASAARVKIWNKCFKISFARPVYNVSLPACLVKVFCLSSRIPNKLEDNIKVNAALNFPISSFAPKGSQQHQILVWLWTSAMRKMWEMCGKTEGWEQKNLVNNWRESTV